MDFGNFFTGGPVQNQNDLMRRQYMAQALLGQANAPGQHPIAALIGNVLGTMRMRKLGREEDRIEADQLAQRERFNKALGEALAGGDRSQIAQALLSSGDPALLSKALDLSLDSGGPEYQVVGGAIRNMKTGEWELPPSAPSLLTPEQERDAALVRAGLKPKATNPKTGTGKGDKPPSAPSGYRYTSAGDLEAIPGGPADPKVKPARARPIPAEQAGRVAIADQYLSDAEKVREGIAAGELTGLWDQAAARVGRGKPGELYRKMQSGKDALQRGLSGAGMPVQEAAEYASRYLPSPMDDVNTLLSKHDQLVKELARFRAIAGGSTTAGQAATSANDQDDPLGIR